MNCTEKLSLDYSIQKMTLPLAQEGMIPRFRNVATRSALASGLLDRSSSFNEQLVDMLVKYEWTIDYVNKALEWAEQERIKVGGRQVAESIRRNLLESPTYSEYLESERQLKTFLELNLSDYTVSVKKN